MAAKPAERRGKAVAADAVLASAIAAKSTTSGNAAAYLK
jgi:hypothetical protein